MSSKPKTPQLSELFLGLIKAGVILAGLAIMAALILSIVFFGPIWRDPPGDRGLDARLRETLSTGDSTVIDLSEMTDFEWTRFCVAGGYSAKSDVETLIQVDWEYWWIPSLQEAGPKAIFLSGDNIVATSDANSFGPLSGRCYSGQAASFRVHRAWGSGALLLEVE